MLRAEPCMHAMLTACPVCCAADNVNANGTFGQLAGLPGQVPYYIFTAGEGVSSNTYQPVWDAWLRFLQPLLTQIPHLATPGK